MKTMWTCIKKDHSCFSEWKMYNFQKIVGFCVKKVVLKIHFLHFGKYDLHLDTCGAILLVLSGVLFQKWGLASQYLVQNQLYEVLNFDPSRENSIGFSSDRPKYRLTAGHRNHFFSENFNSNVNLPTFPNNFTKFHLISLNFHEFFFLNRSSAAEYRICFDFVLILKLRLSVAGSKD